MTVTKQITIYDAPIADKGHQYDPNASIAHIDDFMADEARAHERLRVKNTPIVATMPSMLIKNIIYNVMPIVDNDSPYKMHIQLPVPIKVATIGAGINIKHDNEIISMSGIHFDSDATFFRTPVKYTNLTSRDRFLMGGNDWRDIEYTFNFAPIINLILQFTQQRTDRALKPIRISIKFTSDEDAINKINMIYMFMMSRRQLFIRMYSDVANIVFATPEIDASLVVKRKSEQMPRIEKNIAVSAMEKMLNMELSHLDEDQFMGILSAFKMVSTYVSILLGGRPVIDKIMKKYRTEMNIRIAKNIQRSEKMRRDAAAAWMNNIALREFQTPLSNLTREKVSIVENRYKNEYDAAVAMRLNKCPHLSLLRTVMVSRASVFNESAWDKLKKYVPLKPPPLINGTIKLPEYTSMLKCDMCHFSALCPHHYILFDMRDKMFDGDTTKTADYVIRTFSKDMRSEDDSYYCRICGELILRNLVEGEIWTMKTNAPSSSFTDALSNTIHTEVWQTISMNLDMGAINIDKASITNNIVEVINPHIRAYELKLSRIKTNTENVVLFSLYLIISAYTFAAIIHLANASGGDITIRGVKIKGLNSMDLLHRLFNAAFKLIVKQRASTIDRVPAFTPDRIKKILTRAYQQISGINIEIETAADDDFFDPIYNNTVYNFIYLGHVISDINNGKPRPKYADTKKILGVPFDDIKDLRMMFDRAKIPAAWKNIDSYYWDSYSFVASRILSNTFTRDIKYKKTIDDAVIKLNERWEKIVAADAVYKNVGSRICIEWSNMPQTYDRAHLHSVMYCRDGKSHVWNIYIYKHGQNVVEVRSGQFGKVDITNMDLVTRKCSVCGDKYGETKHTNINDILSYNVNIAAFFKLYKYKCPVKYRHNFINDTCLQCGVTKSQINDKDEKYYEKYKDTYIKEKTRVVSINSDSIFKINANMRRDSMIVVKGDKNSVSIKPWVYSNDSVIKLSKTMTIPYNVLLNIGIMRDYDFDAIKSGSINPNVKASVDMLILHTTVINGYIIDLISKYNRFITCSSIGMHGALEEMCKTKHDEILSMSPLDLKGYFAERRYRKHEPARHYANWTLSWFCDMILRIYNEKKHSSINIKFATIFMDEVMEAELNSSKPKLYKRIIASVKATETADNDTGVNMSNIDIADSYVKDHINIDDDVSLNVNELDIDDMSLSMGDDIV